MIEQFAAFYVHVLLPAGKAAIVFIVILTVLWLLIVMNDAKKGKELVYNSFQWIWNAIRVSALFIGLGVWYVIRFVIRTVHMIFVTIRDFFVSPV